LQDFVQHFVFWKSILILLIIAQFCAWGFGNNGLRNGFDIAIFGCYSIDIESEPIDFGFIKVGDRSKGAVHVAIKGTIACGKFALVACGEQKCIEFIRPGHQQGPSNARLQILFGGIIRLTSKRHGKRLEVSGKGNLYRYSLESKLIASAELDSIVQRCLA